MEFTNKKMFAQIDAFFNTYHDWISEMFPNVVDTAEQHSPPAAQQLIEASFRFCRPGVNAEEISRLSAVVPELPDYYEYFLSQYAYPGLEVPVFTFPATDSGADGLLPLLERGASSSVLPFAYDKLSTGLYCVDYSDKHQVVFFQSSEKSPSSRVLASSFTHVLSFIREFLDWGGDLSALDEAEASDAISDLRAVDPVGLGDSAVWKSGGCHELHQALFTGDGDDPWRMSTGTASTVHESGRSYAAAEAACSGRREGAGRPANFASIASIKYW